jgi:uncharacterized protein YgiM (DUF1202 family)
MNKFVLFVILLLGSFTLIVQGQQTFNQTPDKDLGVDYVVVKNENVNMRSGSTTTASIVTLVQKKEKFVLLNRNSENGFYLVSDLNRSLKGWIFRDFVEIWLTNTTSAKESFKPTTTQAVLPKLKLPTCGEPQNFINNDPGIDLVKVNVDGLFLLSSNDSVSFVLKNLTKKDNLVFISKTDDNKGYEVFDTDTNQKGWVSCLDTTVYLTKKPKQNVSILEVKTNKNQEPPTLVIENTQTAELTFLINSEKITLAPSTSKSISIPSGTANYLAFFPKSIPFTGSKNWENGVIYSLKFN